MTFILAIEGADGAGKATAAAGVTERLKGAGVTAELLSFPRYGETAGGYALGEFLSGRLKREVSPRAAAVLYALDRMESAGEIERLASRADVVVMDRYIASNMAYQAAKLGPDEASAMREWIVRLETDLFALPKPSLSIYLDTPLDVARELILRKRPRDYTEQQYDQYEADLELQRRVRENYEAIVERDLLGPWLRVGTVAANQLRPAGEIAAEIAQAALTRLRGTIPLEPASKG